MWQTYLWTSIFIIFMIIYWVLLGVELNKEEKKRDKTYYKLYLAGTVLYTIISIGGIGLSIMEFRDPYFPPPLPEVS